MKKPRLVRIILALLLPIAVSVTTIEVCIAIAKNKIYQQADQAAEINRQMINRSTGDLLAATKWINMTVASTYCSLDSANIYRFNRNQNEKLSEEILYERMESFAGMHKEYSSVGIILEEGAMAKGSPRFAGSVRQGKPCERIDLLAEEDFFSRDLYQKAVGEVQSSYSIITESFVNNSLTFIHIIPMYDENDKLVGELWFDFDLESLKYRAVNLVSYKNSPVLIVDTNSNIVMASNVEDYFGMTVWDAISDIDGEPLSVRDKHLLNEALTYGTETALSEVLDHRQALNYIFKIDQFDLVMLMIISRKEMYASLTGFKHALLLVSILGILLVFLFSLNFFQSYYHSEKENLAMQNEMEIASKLQIGLLPAELPSVEGVDIAAFQRSALQVGGDLYDCRVRDGKLGFCVGDVSGKGITACMYMAMAASNLRSAFLRTQDTAQMMRIVNRALADRNDTMMFCTMFIGILDLNTRVLSFCNAGHDRPLLKTADGWDFLPMEKNIPLGIDLDYEFKAQQIQLSEGDSLYIYTDGVTEARSEARKLFGEQRLKDVLAKTSAASAESINASVLAAIEDFCQTAPQSDDITMLSISTSPSRAI